MAEPLRKTDVRKQLSAFADGELDAQQHLRVLEHMAANPDATRAVMHQQQLRQAVNRSARGAVPAAPEALRKKILQLRVNPKAQPAQPQPKVKTLTTAPEVRRKPAPKDHAVLAVIGRWAPLSAAAVLFLASLVILNRSTPVAADSPISQSQYVRFVSRYNDCSKAIERLNGMTLFAQNLQELPASLQKYLGGPTSLKLDLSSLGYEFAGAGNCSIPGEGAAHLMYRAKSDPTGQTTLSLWVRQDTGQLKIEPNRLYVVTGQSTANPMILWRQGGMTYYLLGNSLDTIDRAAKQLRVRS